MHIFINCYLNNNKLLNFLSEIPLYFIAFLIFVKCFKSLVFSISDKQIS